MEERNAEVDRDPAVGFGTSTWRASVADVLDWIHADPERCRVDWVSITTPSTTPAAGGEGEHMFVHGW
jgi:hypothetical protein